MFVLQLLLMAAAPLIAAYDLYLPTHEVSSLLGLSRELYYVSAGVVRESALQFNIPISDNVNKLHFVWRSPDENVRYDIKISSNDSDALRQPHLNVSHSGVIPLEASTWRVTLPCTRKKTADVLVTIDIRIRKFDQTHDLSISRNKRCSASDAPNRHSAPTVNVASHGEDDADSPPPHVVFLGLLLAALAVIAIIALAIISLHLKARKALQFASEEEERLDREEEPHIDPTMKPLPNQMHPLHQVGDATRQQPPQLSSQLERPGSQVSENNHRFPPPPPPSNPPPPELPSLRGKPHGMAALDGGIMSDAESRVTDWVQSQQRVAEQGNRETDPMAVMMLLEVDRLRLKLGQLLQEGTFGRVYQSTLLTDDGEEDVLVKTVVSGSSEAQRQIMISEGTSLHGLFQQHLHTIFKATWDGTSPMLVYPYAKHGNLKRWLLSSGQAGVSTHVVVSLGLQMLKAMQHLHKRKIIHKDIAARNCLLGDGHVLKLSDNALSRDLFPSDYHCLGDNENRPIKWLPVEAIAQKNYSRASDVWSFGVFLWELMTRSQQPFADIDPFEMEGYILEGYRLHQPMNCPDQLYSVLTSCWGLRANERAGVGALHNHLGTLQKQLQQFV